MSQATFPPGRGAPPAPERSAPGRPSRPRPGAGRRRRAWRDRAGQQADHRRLRLLDLPAQRHRDVLLLLRGLRGAAGRNRRRPDRPADRSTCRRSDGDRPACCVELHLRPLLRRDQRPQPALDADLPGGHRAARPGLRAARAAGVRRSRRRAAWPRSAAPSCSAFFGAGGLHGLHVTRRACLARHHDGAGQVKGFRPRSSTG